MPAARAHNLCPAWNANGKLQGSEALAYVLAGGEGTQPGQTVPDLTYCNRPNATTGFGYGEKDGLEEGWHVGQLSLEHRRHELKHGDLSLLAGLHCRLDMLVCPTAWPRPDPRGTLSSTLAKMPEVI
jgi:hypothetical protein